ncbi:MAG: glycosyltransferase family 39 protein [Patescibacteria group bacterium]
MKKYFWTFFCFILIASAALRIVPALNGNFFFTADQGRDAIYVREIIERRQIITKGPQTTIAGVYTGPLWYYFLTIGYLIFAGNPFGGIFMIILLSLGVTALIMYFTAKRVSIQAGLLTGIIIQSSWFFYDTSRWAFNPFPMLFLTVLVIIFLTEFLITKKTKFYILTLVPVALSFNSNLASAMAIFIFYALFGLWAFSRKILTWKTYLLATFVPPAIFMIVAIKQLIGVFSKTGGSLRIFSGFYFIPMANNFLRLLSQGVIPQNGVVSLILIAILVFFYLRLKKKNQFISYFSTLTGILFVISYFWFSWNKGWHDWHTIYLPTLIFVSLVLILLSFKNILASVVLSLVIISQLLVFVPRYSQYLQSSNDPSILANQTKILDWIYKNSEENGFDVYTFMADSDFDYPYQYLFWWYGKGKYGIVPCHYEIFPLSHKYIYVPGGEFNYNKPTKGCDKLRFYIIEPTGDKSRYSKWTSRLENTKLIEKTDIGQINVQKRELIK